jgi:hypothetical protein
MRINWAPCSPLSYSKSSRRHIESKPEPSPIAKDEGGAFAALICNGGQPIAAAGEDALVSTESVAVAFDVTHILDLNVAVTVR